MSDAEINCDLPTKTFHPLLYPVEPSIMRIFLGPERGVARLDRGSFTLERLQRSQRGGRANLYPAAPRREDGGTPVPATLVVSSPGVVSSVVERLAKSGMSLARLQGCFSSVFWKDEAKKGSRGQARERNRGNAGAAAAQRRGRRAILRRSRGWIRDS